MQQRSPESTPATTDTGREPNRPPRAAATVVVVRDGPLGIEVLLLRRAERGDLNSGAWVFPGGLVDAADRAALPFCRGLDAAAADARLGVGAHALDYWAAAVRECFEEAGLLYTREADGAPLALSSARAERLDAWRGPLQRGERSLAALCHEEGLTLAVDELVYFSHWVTPLGRPKRFDTRFFIARAPQGQDSSHDDGELVEQLWIAPAAALTRAEPLKLMTPTHKTLEAYGLAIDDGLIHSESLLLDAPQSFGDYRPANFDPSFNGPVSAADALRLSLNVPAVDLLDRLGPERFAARLAHAGVDLKLPAGAHPNLTIILGGTGVSLEQLVGAFAALNRDGLAGRVDYTPGKKDSGRRLLSPGAAWIIRTVLEQHERDGLSEDMFDAGSRRRVAWKTGTSYGFRDAWALGSTRDYTVGVWVGRPDGTPMPGQYGAVTALPLMFEVVDSLPRGTARSVGDRPPAGLRQVDICWPLGLPEDPAHPELCRRKREAWALADSLPPTLPERDARLWSSGRLDVDVDAVSGLRLSSQCQQAHVRRTRAIARWPSLAYPWLPIADRAAAQVPALAPDCEPDALAAMETLRIDGPADGSAIARAPNSLVPPQVRVRALGTGGKVRWLVNGAWVGESTGGAGLTLQFPVPGDQRITAMADGGAWAEIGLRVLR